jgi:hypothetical protein
MRKTYFGPVLIGIGLSILFAAAFWPSAPIVTAMAIIALGATDAIASRYQGSVPALPVTILHGTTYMLLYMLFVGARLHVPATAPSSAVSSLAVLDVAASAFPMVIALSRTLSCLRQSLPFRR